MIDDIILKDLNEVLKSLKNNKTHAKLILNIKLFKCTGNE